MYVSCMLEFSYRPYVFYSFYRGEGRSDGTVMEWDMDVNVKRQPSEPEVQW